MTTEYDTRPAFETWISSPPIERSTRRHPDDPDKYMWPGQYTDHTVQLAWEAWCEALKLSREPPNKGVDTHHTT